MEVPDSSELDLEALWHDLLPTWSGVVARIAHDPGESDRVGDVPAAWDRTLKAQRRADAWAGLPRFQAYLRESLVDVAVGEGMAGLVLVYLLRDFEQVDDEHFRPGLMIGGIPASEHRIELLEGDVGPLPESLKSVWRNHAFLLLKNRRWLGSVGDEGGDVVDRVRMTAKPSSGWVRGKWGRYETLEILDPGTSAAGCLTRRPGDRAWQDHIVYRDAPGRIAESHRPSLESTLTDWDFDEWEPR
jgi:hypothetical protein